MQLNIKLEHMKLLTGLGRLQNREDWSPEVMFAAIRVRQEDEWGLRCFLSDGTLIIGLMLSITWNNIVTVNLSVAHLSRGINHFVLVAVKMLVSLGTLQTHITKMDTVSTWCHEETKVSVAVLAFVTCLTWENLALTVPPLNENELGTFTEPVNKGSWFTRLKC